MKILGWVLLIAVSHTCFAEDYQKNGLPCVAELCIGDGIPELKKIQWESIDLTRFSRDRNRIKPYLDRIASHYRGDISNQTVLFLASNSFDGTALPLLARISVACEGGGASLSGLYKNKSGVPTDVRINLMQKTPESPEQQWVVTMITREFSNPNGYATQDIKNAEMQLVERYKQFNIFDERGMRKTRGSLKNPPPENASFEFTSHSSSNFYFELIDAHRGNQSPPNPLCLKKINLD